MARGMPAPAIIHTPGAVEAAGLTAASGVNLATAENFGHGVQNFGEDALAGVVLSVIGLGARAAMGRGHTSKAFLEWGLPTLAGLAAVANDMQDRGLWNSIGDVVTGGSRFGTAFFMGKAITNAWLKD